MKQLFFVIALAFASTAVAQSFPTPILAPVVGHRGFSQRAPENTLSSFAENVKAGAQGCEMDIYITKDGKLVCFHDGKLKRIARNEKGEPVEGVIADYDLATLRSFDFGAWKDAKFKGKTIPTIEEALDLLANSDCVPVVEIKVENIEQQVIQAIRDRKLEKRTVIIAFNNKVVANCRKIAPEICCAWLCTQGKNESSAEYSRRIVKTLAESKTNMVDMLYSQLTPPMFNDLTEAGIAVMVWTCDNPTEMARLYKLGVKSITTNVPDKALENWKSK